MEIVTVVLEGALEHRDSMGNGSIIRPGEVQRMSAGTGVTHSEYNASREAAVHLLQIWILPERNGRAPGYEQKEFGRPEGLTLLASGDGRDGSITIGQDARLYLASLTPQGLEIEISPGRHAWVQVLDGAVRLNDHALAAGDGASASDEPRLRLDGEGRVLIFDLA
jgi:redox-sensitive bicupin YhaK (pirin superfamily)